MKAFEKWKNDNCREHCNLVYVGVCADCTGSGTKKDVWRAALEWVLKSDPQEGTVWEMIEKELRSTHE